MFKKFLIAFIFVISLIGCTIQKRSNISSDIIKPGMSKEQVIKFLGKPYKESFEQGVNRELRENLYYKEKLWMRGYYSVMSILHFENGELIALEQGKEVPLDIDNGYITNTDE